MKLNLGGSNVLAIVFYLLVSVPATRAEIMGNDHAGSSYKTNLGNVFSWGEAYSPAVDGVLDNVTIFIDTESTPRPTLYGVIYRVSNDTLVAVSDPLVWSADDWVTMNFSGHEPIYSAESYYLCFYQTGANGFRVFYDSAGTGYRYDSQAAPPFDDPAVWTYRTTQNLQFSIYVGYHAAGPPPPPPGSLVVHVENSTSSIESAYTWLFNSTGGLEGEGYTNSTGDIDYGVIGNGNFTVRVAYPGYICSDTAVQVNSTTGLTVTLVHSLGFGVFALVVPLVIGIMVGVGFNSKKRR